jgi:acetylornithine deacetylase/succinyl-diaminopimelate desuccinylase-like protein
MRLSTAALVLLPLLTLVGARAASPQPASSVVTLASDTRVRAALESTKASEPRTITDQVRFCEVPAPPFKEAARGEVLRRALVDIGLRNVRVDRVGNVLGDRPGQAAHPHVLVAAHLDTVFPEDTPVRVTRQGATLRGPGIGDNCRGLAVLVAVARAMNQADVPTTGTVTFVANVGEEGIGDLRGMKALFGETLKGQIDQFVSLDNGGLHITTVGIGSRRYRVTFKGPGGHSFGDFGIPNPANALGRAVAKIAELEVPSAPRTTFNVGRIGGGTSVNAIPQEVWMEVDLRSSAAAALAQLETRLEQALNSAAADENARWQRPGVVTVTRALIGDRPAGRTPDQSAIVTAAVAAGEALGLSLGFSESSSDANLPMSLKIPAIAIGAGGGPRNTHTLEESFDTTDSWKGTQYALLLTIALAR